MTDITHPTVHGHYAALVNQPGYYYLYALYADYRLNNAWFTDLEIAALLRERLRTVQPALALVQPYRKSKALRLFTERQSRDRFPPDKANEAWRQLRELLDKVGPPPGWPDAPAPTSPRYRHAIPEGALPKNLQPGKPPSDTASSSTASSGKEALTSRKPPSEKSPKKKSPKKEPPPFPKSPVDYTMDV